MSALRWLVALLVFGSSFAIGTALGLQLAPRGEPTLEEQDAFVAETAQWLDRLRRAKETGGAD